jgi:hypothetical protein
MRHEQSRLRQALIACACGALLSMAGAVSALAQQADDDDDTYEQKIIKNILGGMGVDVGRDSINYRERSPLVIPPSLDLPVPAGAGAAANPAWPRDPERVQKKKLAVQNKNNRDANPEEPGTSSRLTPDELRRGINPRAQRITDPSQNGSQEEPLVGRPLTPKELDPSEKPIFSWGGFGFGKQQTSAPFNGEPTRNALTQPPPGYQTPSPNQPYGVGDERVGWKIPTILDRAEGTNGGKDY